MFRNSTRYFLSLLFICLLAPSLLAQRPGSGGNRPSGGIIDVQVRYADGRPAPRGIHIRLESAEGGAEAFQAFQMAGARVLLPRAAAAREVVPDALRAMGAQVDVVDAYRNVVPDGAAARASEVFGKSRRPDWVTFTSSSTVKNLLAVAGAEARKGVSIASIGPVTSKAAAAHGLNATAEASEASADGLIAAILESLQ